MLRLYVTHLKGSVCFPLRDINCSRLRGDNDTLSTPQTLFSVNQCCLQHLSGSNQAKRALIRLTPKIVQCVLEWKMNISERHTSKQVTLPWKVKLRRDRAQHPETLARTYYRQDCIQRKPSDRDGAQQDFPHIHEILLLCFCLNSVIGGVHASNLLTAAHDRIINYNCDDEWPEEAAETHRDTAAGRAAELKVNTVALFCPLFLIEVKFEHMHETAASCIHCREFTQPQANPEYKSQFEYVNDAGWGPSGTGWDDVSGAALSPLPVILWVSMRGDPLKPIRTHLASAKLSPASLHISLIPQAHT